MGWTNKSSMRMRKDTKKKRQTLKEASLPF